LTLLIFYKDGRHEYVEDVRIIDHEYGNGKVELVMSRTTKPFTEQRENVAKIEVIDIYDD
jgi:hypothetical protein